MIPSREVRAAMLASVLVLVAAPALADWPQFHSDPDRPGANENETKITRQNVDRLKVRWSRGTKPSDEGINSSPAVAGGVVYVGSDDGRLYAFKARGGRRLWSRSTDGAIRSSPAVAGNRVFVGSDDGRV